MNENLKTRITRKLDEMSDETGRQLLDYLEFLESKYHRSRRAPGTVQKLAENIEDRLGTVRVADVAAKGTAQVVEAAGRIMEGLAAASRVVAEELRPDVGEAPSEPAAEDESGESAPAPESTEEEKPPNA